MKTFFTWSLSIIAVVGIAVLVSNILGHIIVGSLVAWAVLLVGTFYGFVRLGKLITGLEAGIFVNSRCRMSLSRFQIIMWSILVLSSYATAVIVNCSIGGEIDPLAVAIPEELWVLMGISIVPILGSPILLNRKVHTQGGKQETIEDNADKTSKKKAATEEVAAKKVAESVSEPMSILAENHSIEDASWADLVRSETQYKDAKGFVDISRAQALFFTIVLLLGYGYAFGKLLVELDGQAIRELPAITSGMLALIGISQTAYLGGKAIPEQE